jgi:hypothetical protein
MERLGVTMKVIELKEMIKNIPDDAEVVASLDMNDDTGIFEVEDVGGTDICMLICGDELK